MGDNNEQEDADLATMNNDDDDDDTLLEVIYRGDQLVNIPNVPFRLIIHASVTEIDEETCWGCTTLIEVVFHNKVITIRRNAFRGCSNLQRIELPAGLLRLGHQAFDGCDSLQRIVIPASVQYMGDFAFCGCTSLRGEIVIPASVQYMGDCVFERCTSLESVVFVPTSNVELGYYMFRDCSDLRFVTLPHNLRSIPAGFFYDCTSLAHLQIPVSVTEIDLRAFRGSGLRSVTISENVHQIHEDAFRNCVFLERVTIHSSNNLAMADDNIFANCTSLERVVFAPRTSSIQLGIRMFTRCSNLRFVTLPQNLQSIPEGCFEDCTSLTHLHIPISVEEIGAYVFYGSSIQATKILEEDEFIPGTIMLPPKLRSISESCFEDCKSLTHIRIPPSVQSIGEDALNGSGLRLIEIPKHVQQIRSGPTRIVLFWRESQFIPQIIY